MLSLLSTSKNKTSRGGKRPSFPSQGERSTTTTTTTAATTTASAAAAAAAADESRVVSLNESLETLNEVFPNVEVDEFRHLLSTFSEESRLYVITESLLKRSLDGRVRPRRVVEAWEKFRSKTYIAAAKSLLYKEFKGLSHSTIKAVMAENNFDYSRSRMTLVEIAGKSWRYSLTSFLRGGRPAVPQDLALTTSSGCEELDEEIFALGKAAREKQIEEDLKVARLLNEAEHAAASELVECECCYGDCPWTEITTCSDGHFFCHTCLSRSVQEGLYGQGRNIQGEAGSVRCLSSSALPPCEACVPRELLSAILPPDVLQSLEDKMATESLERSGLDLVRCPFCAYAEVVVPEDCRIRRDATVVVALLLVAIGLIIPLALGAFLGLLVTLIFTLGGPLIPGDLRDSASAFLAFISVGNWIDRAAHRVQRKRRGNFFRCANPRCGRDSCMGCGKEWVPFHKCYEKEEDSVRIYVEKAMADAIKRTCPVCNISFVKSDGCNKLTCPCGYVMCYICRAAIGAESYKHFCQHFRQTPGTACRQCDRCDLYVKEDEAAAIKRAAEKAEAEYFRKFKKPEGWTYRRRDHLDFRRGADITWSEELDAGLDKILDMILA